MAHLALYREWRPKIFDEVVEQKHAVYALRQAVISGQIAHAYLFSGTRGTGKTTLAKIFARAINCLNPQDGNPCNQCAICTGMLDGSLMDIVEMDAASNNSVDSIRRICDEVIFMPAQARYKVYIVDEVHMLSTSAFNALLKTLEEPPAHAVFILATTEPHRIPATILSRCQRYEFRRIPVDSMIARLAEIAQTDAIDVEPEALQTIAALSDGAMRDAISLLDQARASFPGRVSRDDILSLAGVVQDDFMQQMAVAILSGNAPELLNLVDQLVMAGRDMARFVTDLAQHFRNILICRISDNPQSLVRAASGTINDMKELAGQTSSEQLVEMIKGLSALLSDLRWAADARTALEIGLIRLMGQQESTAVSPVMQTQPVKPAAKPAPSAPPLPTPAAAATPVVMPAVTPAVPKAVAAPVIPAAPSVPAVPNVPIKQSAPAPDAIPLPEPPPEFDTEYIPEPEVPAMTQPPKTVEFASASSLPSVESTPAAVVELTDAASQPETVSLTNMDAASLWQKILDYLLAEGQMTLYLFSRPAKPKLSGNVLQIHFAAADQVNFEELNQASSLKLLKSAVAHLKIEGLDVKPILAGAANQPEIETQASAEDDWINKIKKTADTLGIPVKMEE